MADKDDYSDDVQHMHPESGKALNSRGEAYDQTRMLNHAIDPLGNVRTAAQEPVFGYNSNFGVSSIRDKTTTTGSGSVTNNDVRYRLSTGTTTDSTASLRTNQRGRYLPGTTSVAGIGIKVPEQEFSGGEEALWGYFDDNDGFLFGKDKNGNFIEIRRSNGTDKKIYQENWNRDTFDGSNDPKSNPSGHTLDYSNGYIFRILFNWYGFGDVHFRISSKNRNNSRPQTLRTVHLFTPDGDSSVATPNLPIKAKMKNNGDAKDYDLDVYGRQYHVLGEYDPPRRRTPILRKEQSVGTTETPLVSYKYEQGDEDIAVRLAKYEVITDTDVILRVRTGTTLTGASFSNPDGVPADETAIQAETSATDFSVGERIIDSSLAIGGGGSNRALFSEGGLDISTPEDQIVTVTGEGISSSGTVTTNSIVIEEW